MFLVVWPIVWPTRLRGVAMVWPFWRQDHPRCAKAPGAVCGRGWGLGLSDADFPPFRGGFAGVAALYAYRHLSHT